MEIGMARDRDEMMDWVLGEVGGVGLTISTLFQNFEESFANGDSAQLWQRIVVSRDVELGDGDEKVVVALGKLGLSDVLTLGLGGKMVRVKGQKGGDDEVPVKSTTSMSIKNLQVTTLEPETSQPSEGVVEVQPPKRRRGRPPKASKVAKAASPALPMSSTRRNKATPSPPQEEVQRFLKKLTQDEAEDQTAKPSTQSIEVPKRRGRPPSVKRVLSSAVSNVANTMPRMTTRNKLQGKDEVEVQETMQDRPVTPIPAVKSMFGRRGAKSEKAAPVDEAVETGEFQKVDTDVGTKPTGASPRRQFSAPVPQFTESLLAPLQTSPTTTLKEASVLSEIASKEPGRGLSEFSAPSDPVWNEVDDDVEIEDEVDIIQYFDDDDMPSGETVPPRDNEALADHDATSVPQSIVQSRDILANSDKVNTTRNTTGGAPMSKAQDTRNFVEEIVMAPRSTIEKDISNAATPQYTVETDMEDVILEDDQDDREESPDTAATGISQITSTEPTEKATDALSDISNPFRNQNPFANIALFQQETPRQAIAPNRRRSVKKSDQSTARRGSADVHPTQVPSQSVQQQPLTSQTAFESMLSTPPRPVLYTENWTQSSKVSPFKLAGRLNDVEAQRRQTEEAQAKYVSPFAIPSAPVENQARQPSANFSALQRGPSGYIHPPQPFQILATPVDQSSHPPNLSGERAPKSLSSDQMHAQFSEYRSPPQIGVHGRISDTPVSIGPNSSGSPNISFKGNPALWDLETQARRDQLSMPNEISAMVQPTSSIARKCVAQRKISTISHEDVNFDSPPAKKQKVLPGKSDSGSAPKEAAASSPWAVRKKKDLARAEDIGNAQAITFPEGFVRIAAVFDDEAGNLVLSPDQSSLDFTTLQQHPPELPYFSLPVSDLSQDPVISTKGSNPMSLRLRVHSDTRVVHTFKIAQSDDAYNAMNLMRAKIIAARILVLVQDNRDYKEAERIIKKPYKCDGCDSRFKNKGGLDYHLTKSNTICNPSFVPPIDAKARKPRARKESKEPKEPKEPESPKTARPSAVKAQTPSPSKPKETTDYIIQENDDPGSDSSSEDSIIAWAENIATQGMHKQLKKSYAEPLRPKSYRSLPGERALLQNFAEDFAGDSRDANTGDVNITESGAGLGPISVSKDLTNELCEQILIEIVMSNNSIFPGDKGIWFAFVASWAKDYSTSDILPESKLCFRILDELIASKRLTKIEFKFRDTKSRNITKPIIMAPDFDLDSSVYEMMKELVKAAHPGFYVPSHFAPPDKVLVGLETIVRRSTEKTRLERDEEVSEVSFSESGESGDEEMVRMGSVAFDEDSVHEGSVSIESSSVVNEDLEDSDDEDVYFEEKNRKGKRGRRRRASKTRAPRDAESKKKTSLALQQYYAKSRAERLAESQIPRALSSNSGSVPPQTITRRTRAPLTQEEKDRRSANASVYTARLQQCWEPAPTFMPNSTNGAWDFFSYEAERPKSYRRPKATIRRPGFVEPITFIQAPNGAWSERSFGHGVNPIFSRPSRRVDGNPNLQNYLKRIENGHRPILMPKHSQIFFPAAPSKFLLRSEGLAQSPQPRKRRKTESASPPVDKQIMFAALEEETDNLDQDYVPRYPRRTSALSARQGFVRGFDVDEQPARRPIRAKLPPIHVDEVRMLNFFEPRKLLPGAPENPGLKTIPSGFGLPTPVTSASTNSSGWPASYTEVTFVDPESITEDSNFSDGSWVLGVSLARRRTYTDIRYDEETAFTLETLPYEQLDADEDICQPEKREYKRRKTSTPGKSVSARPQPQRLTKTRHMTAIPADFDGVMDDPREAAKAFGAQLAVPSAAIQSRKRFSPGDRMSTEDETRFMVTVVIIRTVTGGLDQLVDWVLVSSVFPEHSLNYMKILWARQSDRKKRLLDALVVDFQDAFLVGYKSDAFPPINFDNLVDYDWAALVKWTSATINTSLTNEHIDLPASRKELLNVYHLKESDRDDHDIQTSFFGLTGPIYKRIESITSKQNTIPVIRPVSMSEYEIDDLMLAKSWARATALTPTEDWDPAIAKQKLSQLGLELVEKALEALKAEKVIIKRKKVNQQLGRAYEAGEGLLAPLRKQIYPSTFAEAYNYKQFLDAEFRSCKECVRVNYLGDEGSYMVVSSLLANGRVRMQGIDIPNNMWGLGDEETGYETKKIKKSTLRWEIDMYPTEIYLFDEDNINLQNLQWVEPPRGIQAGELPIWYGITDHLIPDLWKKVLVAVGGTVGLRSGLTNRGLRMVFKNALEEWEIRLLMEWGEMMGIFVKLDGQGEGEVEGWGVREWWWLFVGKFCAERMAEAQRLKVQAEAEGGGEEEEEL